MSPMECQISMFFPKLMYGRPCQEQAVMTWVVFSAWCLNKPATMSYLCEASGTSQAKVSICLKSLMDDGLICEERISEARVGYAPTVSVMSLPGKSEGVVEDDGKREEIVIGDSKGKEKEEGEGKKKEAGPPDLETIKAVCERKAWRFQPEHFFSYYAEREWRMRDGTAITKRNWYHLGASWHERRNQTEMVISRKNESSFDAAL